MSKMSIIKLRYVCMGIFERALCILWIGVMDWSLRVESWRGVLEWNLGGKFWCGAENLILVVKFCLSVNYAIAKNKLLLIC